MDYEVGAKVVDGRVVFSDKLKYSDNIFIKSSEKVNMYINGEACIDSKEYSINKEDIITYTIENQEEKREINLFISDDKMKASLRIEYFPKIKYKLKDTLVFSEKLMLCTEIEERTEPEHYTVDEVKKYLKDRNVRFGIDDSMLEKAVTGCNKEVVIAKGQPPVKDIPSEVKLFFTPTHMYFPDEESDGKVDYKNLFRISNVNEGDRIAEIIPEIIGKDGTNIFGQTVKKPYVRLTPVVAKEGCKIEENQVIATIDGKAHISGKIVSVNPIYTVESVNMETCNINFYGDIEVYDSVDDHMNVNAGGSLDVSKNINTANVITGGDITILGNAINSKILSGQIDIRKKEYADILTSYKKVLCNIIECVKKANNGEAFFGTKGFIKELTDERFTDFQKLALKIVAFNLKNEIKGAHLTEYLKEKVLGYNILNIQSLNDLTLLLNILNNEIDYYDKNSIVPLDIRLSYCQDCEIKSTGNIYITGKGEYTSILTAMKDIMFTKSDSVVRGGVITSGNNITAGIIGSVAEIATILKVPKTGRISSTRSYPNTTFYFGDYKITLDREYNNMQAYYNKTTRLIEVKDNAF